MTRIASLSILAIVSITIGSGGAANWIASRADDSRVERSRTRPVLVMPSTRQDLGIMDEGSPLIARFEVSNDGDRRLIIRHQNSACCGQFEGGDVTTVPPGASAELLATVDVAGHTGKIEKTVAYATNDSAQPKFELVISAEIRPSSSTAEPSPAP